MEREVSPPVKGAEYSCLGCNQLVRVGDAGVIVEKSEEEDPDGLFPLSYGVWHKGCYEHYLAAGEE
jgi:hypothetical protein